MKRTVSTDEAPAAVGAYSQATTTGDLLFTAGQLPLTVEGELLDDEPVAVRPASVSKTSRPFSHPRAWR